MSAIAHRAAMLPLADSRDGTVYLVLDPLRVVAFNTADGWMRDVGHRTRAAISWSGRARESSPEPTPMATLLYGGIFGDNSAGATPQRHRPSRR